MTKIPFDTFLDDIMPELPGCGTDLALFHVRRAVNDFGRISRYLKHTLPKINVVAGTGTYSVVTDDPDLQLIEPSQVWYDGDILFKRTVPQLNREYRAWRTEQGVPAVYTRLSIDSITLVQVPDTSLANGLEIECFVTPDFNATGFDEYFYDLYADEIAAGAKARLMRMAKKPWSNPQQSMLYQMDFDKGANTAKIQALGAFTGAPSRSRTYYR